MYLKLFSPALEKVPLSGTAASTGDITWLICGSLPIAIHEFHLVSVGAKLVNQIEKRWMLSPLHLLGLKAWH